MSEIREISGHPTVPAGASVSSRRGSTPRSSSALVEGALDCLLGHGVAPGDVTLVRVPGAWEIPQALDELAAQRRFRGADRAGRGDPRRDRRISRLICAECCRGSAEVACAHRTPVGVRRARLRYRGAGGGSGRRRGGQQGLRGRDGGARDGGPFRALARPSVGGGRGRPCDTGPSASAAWRARWRCACSTSSIWAACAPQVFAHFDLADFLGEPGAAHAPRPQGRPSSGAGGRERRRARAGPRAGGLRLRPPAGRRRATPTARRSTS